MWNKSDFLYKEKHEKNVEVLLSNKNVQIRIHVLFFLPFGWGPKIKGVLKGDLQLVLGLLMSKSNAWLHLLFQRRIQTRKLALFFVFLSISTILKIHSNFFVKLFIAVQFLSLRTSNIFYVKMIAHCQSKIKSRMRIFFVKSIVAYYLLSLLREK